MRPGNIESQVFSNITHFLPNTCRRQFQTQAPLHAILESEGDIPMSHTVSPDQLAANRANAANSSGPRTPEGKLRSSQNARKHGFTASTFAVVRLEDLNEVANLREDLVNLYHPVNSQELFALERVALAQQAILRAARLEAGFLSNCLSESFGTNGQPRFPMKPQLTAGIEISQAQNDNYLLGDGFYAQLSHNPT